MGCRLWAADSARPMVANVGVHFSALRPHPSAFQYVRAVQHWSVLGRPSGPHSVCRSLSGVRAWRFCSEPRLASVDCERRRIWRHFRLVRGAARLLDSPSRLDSGRIPSVAAQRSADFPRLQSALRAPSRSGHGRPPRRAGNRIRARSVFDSAAFYFQFLIHFQRRDGLRWSAYAGLQLARLGDGGSWAGVDRCSHDRPAETG